MTVVPYGQRKMRRAIEGLQEKEKACLEAAAMEPSRSRILEQWRPIEWYRRQQEREGVVFQVPPSQPPPARSLPPGPVSLCTQEISGYKNQVFMAQQYTNSLNHDSISSREGPRSRFELYFKI